jgi:hypothetical protein
MELIKSVARRIVDRDVLHLIKMWLKAPVEERDENGKRRMAGGRSSQRGTPQGGIVSPMLANLYMNRFLKLADHRKEQGFPRSGSHVCGRFRDSQPRPCGGGTGLDAQRDDAARPYFERSENQHQGNTQGELSLSELYVRAASLQAGWSLVYRSQSVEEESATHQAESGRPINTRKRWRMGRSARSSSTRFCEAGRPTFPTALARRRTEKSTITSLIAYCISCNAAIRCSREAPSNMAISGSLASSKSFGLARRRELREPCGEVHRKAGCSNRARPV